jgi:hypothetical protein
MRADFQRLGKNKVNGVNRYFYLFDYLFKKEITAD